MKCENPQTSVYYTLYYNHPMNTPNSLSLYYITIFISTSIVFSMNHEYYLTLTSGCRV